MTLMDSQQAKELADHFHSLVFKREVMLEQGLLWTLARIKPEYLTTKEIDHFNALIELVKERK
jgi:hypothetical protein